MTITNYVLSFFDIYIDYINVLLDCTHFDLFNHCIDSRGLRSYVCNNVNILCSVLNPTYMLIFVFAKINILWFPNASVNINILLIFHQNHYYSAGL